MTAAEQDRLYALCCQAFELRETPYLSDASEAICAWHERRRLARHELEQEKDAAALRLLRECREAA